MVRRIRLISGLIMFGYILGHFLNHALGLVSLEFMDAVQRRKPGLNVVCLMGQSAVRAYVHALNKMLVQRAPGWEALRTPLDEAERARA